jgi:UDPglucose 6-dehydrogenase
MKISTVGVGYVGLVAAACFAESGNTVYCVDKGQAKIDNLNNGIIPNYEQGLTEIVLHNTKAGRLKFTTDLKEAVNNSKVIFIGVGTPMAEDGSADLSAAFSVCGDIAEYMQEYKIIVMKSTVPVGTHKKIQDLVKSKTNIPFDYVSNPEFLKEGSAVEDFMKPDRVIIGTENPDVREVMNQLYSPFMRKSSRVLFMDAASAEIAKYASNVMLATRISFMNELSALCETFNADIEKVRSGVGSDPRIGNSFLFAGVGYGGSCFPKDVSALINIGNQNECPMLIAQAAKQANYNQHNRFANRVIEYYKNIGGKIRLAVWGLAFKAKTDDVRESPAIWCINKFLENGFEISAFDPEAINAAKKTLGSKINYGQNDYDIIDGADGLVIFTDWQQFRNPDFDLLKSKLKRSVIFDGRNLFESNYVRKQGFEYYSIGRP